MNWHQHSYNNERDWPAVQALKQTCTTAYNRYDAPTAADLEFLLAPQMLPIGATEQSWHVTTQHLTTLWEDAQGSLLAYALIAQPGISLTFQVHPLALGCGIETEILAWGEAQMQSIAQGQRTPRELWCRCHLTEEERRRYLQAADFAPLPERDLRMECSLAVPLPQAQLPAGIQIQYGVGLAQLDQYQALHQAIFAGISMSFDYHQSSRYQPELDLIAVDTMGQFVAFCQCELKQLNDNEHEYTVGEVGLVGTHPAWQRRGLGRALLLTGLQHMKARGATHAFLETQEMNALAQHLFTDVGFTVLSTWQWFTKTISPS